jgi:hypothetical protein
MKISAILNDGFREVRVGQYVAYGQFFSGEEYNIVHAPTQTDMDVVSTVVDCADPEKIEAAMAAGDEEALQRWAADESLMDW